MGIRLNLCHTLTVNGECVIGLTFAYVEVYYNHDLYLQPLNITVCKRMQIYEGKLEIYKRDLSNFERKGR